MTLDRLRNALFFKPQHQRNSAAASAMTNLSEYRRSSWSSTHEDFTRLRFFVWTGGDPGFTLTTNLWQSDDAVDAFSCDEDAELRVDCVTASKVWDAGIRPGDVLETVANKRVHTMDTEAAIVLVQMSRSPSIVRFRSPKSSKRMRFDILLTNQKLGLALTGDGSSDIPVVTRLMRAHNREASASVGVRLGDVLVAVNGMDAIAAGLGSSIEYIERSPRPLRLTFERVSNDGCENQWLGSQVACEQSGEQRRGTLSLRSAIPAMVSSTRETARLRCKSFLHSLMPSGVQFGTGNPARDHALNISEARGDVLIEWENGPLGLTLLEDVISGAPVVNRLTGKGSSANMERLQHGFQLYSINGVRTEGRALKAICKELMMAPKPVSLIFRPPSFDDDSEEGNLSETSPMSPSLKSPSSSPSIQTGLDTDDHQASRASAVKHCGPQQPSSIRNQHEYEVVLATNQLGLELEIPHTSASTRGRYPIVHKILKESTLGLPSDAVGHLFVAINNWCTSGLSTTELRTLLQVATKPAVLRFRKHEGLPGFQRTFVSLSSHDDDKEILGTGIGNSTIGSAYNILWSEGELGITFGCYQDADRRNALVVYVKHIGPGQAQNSKLVALGDILCSINGHELPPRQKFKKTIRALLKSSKQPVTLGFRRLLVERCSDCSRQRLA
ncbi:unnamed protein product [Phytophthora lilii]|uniref:Unnamed protein product n=1 Tax=Phytophthora lilii TaxID=2077276 RepID=A0A9W6TN89_9STRA|nr:unnamed protein product [Phytophthora lilii]